MSGLRMHRLRPAAAIAAVVLSVALLVVGAPLRVGAAPAGAARRGPTTTAPPAPPPPPKAFVLVDLDTGRVVDAGNDHVPLPPASLTKVITALAARTVAPDTGITVSDRAAAAPADKMSLKAGQVWTADELFHALLLASANDAAISLAEQVGGSVEGFQPVFARTALGLGMVDQPVLMDPAGLDGPAGVEGGNLVSARDLAIAGRTLLADPYLAAIVATPVYYFDGPDNVHHRLTNHNKRFLVTYPGAIGVKTGYTRRAGACLMAAARQGGRTMLAVVLGSANPTAAAMGLLDQGFATAVPAESPDDALPPLHPAALPTGAAAADPPADTTTAPGPGSTSSGLASARPASTSSWIKAGEAVMALGLLLVVVSGSDRRRRRRLWLTASRPRHLRGGGRRRR